MKTSIKSIADDSLFAAINKLCQKTSAQNFTLLVCDKAKLTNHAEMLEENVCYYGIKASKKIGNAVIRNKIKRRLRALLRNLMQRENALTQKVCVIIPKKSCVDVEFAKLEQRIMNGLSGNAQVKDYPRPKYGLKS